MNYPKFHDKFVFADSSFFICFLKELKQSNCYNFLDYYNFAIGSKVLKEINEFMYRKIEQRIKQEEVEAQKQRANDFGIGA